MAMTLVDPSTAPLPLAWTLARPAMLLGLAALALPLALHLWRNRSRRRVAFSSIEPLRAAGPMRHAAQRGPRRRLTRYALLALRCATIALIVLAFARPEPARNAPSPARGAGVVPEDRAPIRIVLLDRSASTRRAAGGVPRFELLRAEALRAIDRLDPAHRVQFLPIDAAPRGLPDTPTRNRAALRDAVRRLEPGDERAAVRAALATAAEALRGAPPGSRLLLLTDGQASNWTGLDPAALPPRVPLEISDVALNPSDADAPDALNASIVDVRCEPQRPATGETFDVVVAVRLEASAAATIPVAIHADGRRLAQRRIRVAPHETTETRFTLRAPASGEPVRLRATIPADAFALDNERFAVASPRPVRRVLLIAEDAAQSADAPGFFLARAIAPRSDTGRDAFDVIARRPRALTAGDFDAAALVVLADGLPIDTLDPAVRSAWSNHHRRGGWTLAFVGERRAVRSAIRLGPMIGAATPRVDDPAATAHTAPATAERRLAAPAAWPDWFADAWGASAPAIRRGLTDVRFAADAAWPVLERPAERRRDDAVAGEVLARFGDGEPAWVAWPAHRGRLLIAGFTPRPTATDLPTRAVFPVLLRAVAEAATAPPPLETLLAGHPLTLALPGPMREAARPEPDAPPLRVLGPGGEPIHDAVTFAHPTPRVVIPRVAKVGHVRVMRGDRLLAAAAVNVDPREFDGRRLNAAQLRAAVRGSAPPRSAEPGSPPPPADTTAASAPGSGGVRPEHAWALLLALGLAAIGAESLASARLGRPAEGGRP